MPRARNIKPGFFTNDELVELPMATRLLFIGLWTLADREGRIEDRPKKIKMEVFPADDVNVDEALSTLVSSAFIQRYTVDGVAFIQVENFIKHQRPHSNESASIIPPPSTGRRKKARNDAVNNDTANHSEQGGTPRQSSRAGAGAIKTDTGLLNDDLLIPDTGLLDPDAREPAPSPIPPDPPVKPLPPSSDPPFALLESLCDTLGQDVSVLGKSERNKQLAVAKRLADTGMSSRDVASMTCWLKAQAWVTGGIDLFFLERQLGKWQLAGKPSNLTRIEARAAPNSPASIADRNQINRQRAKAGPPTNPDDDVIDTQGRITG